MATRAPRSHGPRALPRGARPALVMLASLAVLAALAASGPARAGSAEVRFVQPETYRDANPQHRGPDSEAQAAVQAELQRHLERLAQQRLGADERLAVQVLDIDLAGEIEPWRRAGGQDLRIVRDITMPRMTLSFTLTRGSDVLASAAQERVTDLNFLRGFNRYSSSDPLRYEKAMLDQWFEARFARR